MDLKNIMSVSGQPGLFRFISNSRNGIIVESFVDQKRSFVSSSAKVSSLEEIAVFTSEKEVPLVEVLKNIFNLENELPVPDPKSEADTLKKFMGEVLPDYDREKVYLSDIKKIVAWYSFLKSNDLLDFSDEATNKDSKEDKEENTEDKQEA